MGLKGTGSGDIEVRDVLVPRERSVSLIADPPVEPGPLYKFPVFGLLSLGVCAVALGNAGSEEAKSILERSLGDPDSLVREHVEWGVAQYD